MFLNSLTHWLRKPTPEQKSAQQPSTRLRLEELEDRLVPAPILTETYTNASVQITPGFIVTETVTATVTPFPRFNFKAGSPGILPNTPPPGATPPPGGTVIFELNGLQQHATVNSNGQATVTFQVPLLAFLGHQTLTIGFEGFADNAQNVWYQSAFTAAIYKNFDNLLLPATITFNPLTPQQEYAQFFELYSTNPPKDFPDATVFSPESSVNGETDTLAGGLVAFHYVDPGVIDSITALGMQFPGILAFQLGAFKGLG